MGRPCPQCDRNVPDGAAFCMACGASLTDDRGGTGPRGEPTSQVELLDDERRHVTVLFVDMVGYTSFAEATDPEDLKAVMGNWLVRLGREVEKRGGRVHQYLAA